MAAHMAKQVRGLTAYDPLEKFDLGGFTQEQVAEFVPLAFTEPFSLQLRVSFVVGGGRLVRARYHDDLQKWLSSALRELGFEEDRGAAIGSTAAFKRQEDLAQNLCVAAGSAQRAGCAQQLVLLVPPTWQRLNLTPSHSLHTPPSLPLLKCIFPRVPAVQQASHGGRWGQQRCRVQ